MAPLLEVREVSKVFGGLKALDEVSLGVAEGQIFGLIGPNGAGKTTLFNLISGALPVSSGAVFFRGADLSRLPDYRICRMGIARTYQNIRLFGKMTVLENVMLGQHSRTRAGLGVHPSAPPAGKSRERRRQEDGGGMAGIFSPLRKKRGQGFQPGLRRGTKAGNGPGAGDASLLSSSWTNPRRE